MLSNQWPNARTKIAVVVILFTIATLYGFTINYYSESSAGPYSFPTVIQRQSNEVLLATPTSKETTILVWYRYVDGFVKTQNLQNVTAWTAPCPDKHCVYTYDRNQLDTANAIVVMHAWQNNFKDLPLNRRKPNQYYIFFAREAPSNFALPTLYKVWWLFQPLANLLLPNNHIMRLAFFFQNLHEYSVWYFDSASKLVFLAVAKDGFSVSNVPNFTILMLSYFFQCHPEIWVPPRSIIQAHGDQIKGKMLRLDKSRMF